MESVAMDTDVTDTVKVPGPILCRGQPIAKDVDTSNTVKVPGVILRREQARLEELERRRKVRKSQAVSEEDACYFSSTFASEKTAIEELLSGCVKSDQEKAIKTLEEATLKTRQLQKFLNDSMMFLTSYKLRQAQESLQKLHGSIAERRDEVMPRKKFAFRSRTAVSSKPSAATEKEKPALAAAVVDAAVSEEQCGFSNISSQVLTKSSEEIKQKFVLLSNLTNCTVRLMGLPSCLRIKNVRDCQIFSGPVSSSVFVEECKGCTLVLACQQLRTHNTTDTQIYIHITSRAIIENCHGVRFAPFNWKYEGMEDDFKVSGLDLEKNNWFQVDDFNWLTSNTPSPNWSVIPESERFSFWDTTESVT